MTDESQKIVEWYGARIIAVEAEVEALREALEQTLDRLVRIDGNLLLAIYDAQLILRAALL
jgi:hypothetical protein